MQKFPTLYNRDLTDDDEMSSMAEAEQHAEMEAKAASADNQAKSGSTSK